MANKYGTRYIQRRYAVPTGLSDQELQAVGDEMVSYIILRTQRGLGEDLSSLPNYTPQYAKFKGTSVGNVDLTLEGELLANLTVLEISDGFITIGYESGTPLAGKAEGNISGSYGGEPDESKARDFLALSQNELTGIFDRVLLSYSDFDGEDLLNQLADLSGEDIEALREFIGE